MWLSLDIFLKNVSALDCVVRYLGFETFTLRKLECFKQARALNTFAWNKKVGLQFYFVGF